ncbi:MAG TPA: Stp1/IreP family PP2C-type Ser/Thr phosphatase [Gaiellaceae bacterium]|nr:Stp1/IreP family PP2C-type Ser/Thr phosphatase [Gaiellaceae bacterium]
MRVAQTAGVTDAGRKRRRNEDAYVVDPPLFAVADGMGGAQAGEVASQLAAAVLRGSPADEGDPEQRVVALIQEANRQIYERARSDAHASGMGTTITAAMLARDAVAIGHVGDSRAYRIRGGELEQLTEDHSLVADLMRSGRLTPEEAETHPQRSVITRALGTDPDVDVDTLAVDAEPGDVFLLCSDGLTTMVGDDEILQALAETESLEEVARRLVKAANRRGGEDNITIVLFRVDGNDVGQTNGRGPEQDLEDTLSGLEAPTLTPPPAAAEAAVAEPAPAPAETVQEPAERARRRWPRVLVWSLLALAFLVAIVAAAIWGLARSHFVGASDDGYVAVYQGVPVDLGGGVVLYRARYISRLQAVQLSSEERAELFDHEFVTYDEARRQVAPYEEEATP